MMNKKKHKRKTQKEVIKKERLQENWN
jgi:hypothetical protein